MDSLRQDLSFALRSLRRNPMLALVAVCTLAVGIGANTAIFSVMNAVLIESPSYRNPDRLVLVWHRMLAVEDARVRVAAPDAAVYRDGAASLEGLAFLSGSDDLAIEGSRGEGHVRVGVATPNLFDVLGVGALHGRTFRSKEGVLSRTALQDPDFIAPPSPVLLEHDFWQRRFGGDPTVVGRTLRLSGTAVTVVGVLDPEFELVLPPGTGLPGDIDAWSPLVAPLDAFRRPQRLRDQDADNTGVVVARLAPTATLAGAREELSALAARLRAETPMYEDAELRVEIAPLVEDATRHARPVIIALMGAVLFVLLIACINVANLLLARATDRRFEMIVRSALGASNRRLLRQVLTEGAVLAVIGASLGLLLAAWGVDLLLAAGPAGIPRADQVGMDGRVLLFGLLTTVGAALVFGAAPALVLTRQGVDGLRANARVAGGRKGGLSRALVICEVALSFALLVGAGLMLRSTANLQRVELGFEPRELLTFQVAIPAGTIGGPSGRAAFLDELEHRIRDVPGVEAVGLTGGLPLGGVVWRQPYGAEGSTLEEWTGTSANFRMISAEYFEAMGTRLLAGRAFTPAENLNENERVAIVDAALAASLAPDGNAIGQTIGFPLDGDPVRATIVGVVEDVRFHDLREPSGETIYVPYRQEASRTISMAVRASAGTAGLADRIRDVGAGLDGAGQIPLYDFRDMQDYVSRALGPTRFALLLVGLFAMVAVALAAIGLAGVVSYAVSTRTREFGIRMVLGADSRTILKEVLKGGSVMALAGTGIGFILATTTTFAFRDLLFDVSRLDPLTYGLVAVLLIAVTVGATWLPARRASSLEPAVTLQDA